MKHISIPFLALFFLTLAFTQAPAQDVYINLSAPRQTVDGAGFCHEGDRQNGNYYILDQRIQQMLDNNMSLFRDMFPNKTWEPSKGVYNYNDDRVLNCIKRLKVMQDRGIKTILGIWDVPNWLVSNPSAGSNRKINNFDDFAWFITSFLLHGKNNYNLTVDYLDVNETRTSGINISMTAQEYITLIQKCQALFTANGIQTKINLGSVLLWDIQYCKDIYNAVHTLSVAGHPSWHTYRGGSTTGREPISYWENWGAWQQTIDRNLWGTETDYDAYYWENPQRLTWQGVEEMAVMYYRNYYVARMSTSAGWFWRTDWPSHNVHLAYMRHFEPGGQVVETSQPDGDVMTVAYKHEAHNKFVIQVVNQSSSAKTVSFHGVPANQPLTLVRTSEAGDRSNNVGDYTPNGSVLTVTLQANSFNTFYGELGQTNPPAGPATVYADCPFAGAAVALQPGDYTQAQLQSLGMQNNSISSVKVQSGYKITLYADDNFTGSTLELTADDDCIVDNNFNDLASSIRVSSVTGSPNLAYNRPVFTTSNENASLAGQYAVDADGNTRWSSAYANNQSIVVDLGANYSVNRVRLAWETAYAKDYQIQFSTNNTTWTTVREFWGKSSAAADDQTGLSGTARYVKVYCINRATQYGFSLYEFEVYGTPQGGSLMAAAPDISITGKTSGETKQDGIVAWPSPTRGMLKIELPAGWQKGCRLQLISSTGKVLLQKQIDGGSGALDLSPFPSGWYLVRVEKDGKQLVTRVIRE
jgi:hypothetical protein